MFNWVTNLCCAFTCDYGEWVIRPKSSIEYKCAGWEGSMFYRLYVLLPCHIYHTVKANTGKWEVLKRQIGCGPFANISNNFTWVKSEATGPGLGLKSKEFGQPEGAVCPEIPSSPAWLSAPAASGCLTELPKLCVWLRNTAKNNVLSLGRSDDI